MMQSVRQKVPSVLTIGCHSSVSLPNSAMTREGGLLGPDLTARALPAADKGLRACQRMTSVPLNHNTLKCTGPLTSLTPKASSGHHVGTLHTDCCILS